MTARGIAIVLAFQGLLVGVAVALVLGVDVWAGIVLGAIFGASQVAIVLIGDSRGWLRKDALLLPKREAAEVHREFFGTSKSVLAYGVLLSLVAGIMIGIVSEYQLLAWLLWIPVLVFIGVLLAAMLARAGR